jgi:aminoglycoside phosphotransferase (APT) family kinase protein
MHADQVRTDVLLVRRLLAAQFPQWSSLPVKAVQTDGTDHDIYRVGESLAARLPRLPGNRQAEREAVWLPRLAPLLPLAIPRQVAEGRPGEGYPFAWTICEWLPGEMAPGSISDLPAAAAELAAFITALRGIDTAGAAPAPRGSRGGLLADGDQDVRRAIAELGDRVDGTAALRSWEESVGASAWHGPGAWIHGDLLPGNLLVTRGRLSAVIDFGCLTVGDPACDLLPAWNLFAGDSRAVFRAGVGADSDSWLRGRGWALRQAVVALPYYWDTNPGMVRQASHALAQILADPTDE